MADEAKRVYNKKAMIKKEDKNRDESEKLYTDFISTVSHELRTPLTSIRGFADTLLTSYDRLSPEQREKFLIIIKEQSNRLINLVENLLTVSKMNSGKELLVFKNVDVTPFIETTVQMLKNKYKTHKFICNYEKNLPKIMTDTDKFQQIMLNLIDNAAKYSPENSSVYVSALYLPGKNEVRVTVKDEGIGISSEDIGKIFNKFSRIDSPLTRKVQGNGLGLYITKTIVEKTGGRITVKSEGKGSEFTVSYPGSEIDDDGKRKLKEC